MNHLGKFLLEVMNALQLDAKTFGEQLGVHPSIISRILKGRRHRLNEKTKLAIITGCGQHPSQQAQCLAAFLKDQVPAAFASRIRISVLK